MTSGSPPALEQGSDDEDEEIGVLERRARHHSPISVASSPAVPMSGTRDRPMLVEESPEPHYIVVEDSPAPQCIVVEESPAPMSGVKDRPVFVEESPPTSPVPMSGTNDRPSLVDESPAVPMVGNLCWGGENPLEGGSATLPINLVSPPTTASRMEEPQSRAIPNWGGGSRGHNGRETCFCPSFAGSATYGGSSIPSVYCSGRISTAAPSAQSCGSCFPAPITPAGGLHRARGRNPVPDPAIPGWEFRGGAFIEWGGACTCYGTPGTPSAFYGGVLWSLRGWWGCWWRR